MWSLFGALLQAIMDSISHCILQQLLRITDLASTAELCRYRRKRRRPTMESGTEQYVYCKDCEASNRRQSNAEVRPSIVLVPRKYRRRKMNWQLLRILLSLCLLLSCDAKRVPKSGPPTLESPRVRVTATVGQPRLILKCGVTSAIPPLIKWKFNGASIPMGNPRLRETNNHLRIKNVKADDAGKYTCTASNLYGKVEQQINLVVNDARGRTAQSQPRFTMPSKMRRKHITKPSNSMLKLRCAAAGHPAPQIEWTKDGNVTQPPGTGRKTPWTFKIRKLQQNDSGRYQCRVWNSEGEITFTYEVHVIATKILPRSVKLKYRIVSSVYHSDVTRAALCAADGDITRVAMNHRLSCLEQLRKKPVVLAPHPMNTTVQVGGMTSLRCLVQSLVQPTVKWIKKIEPEDIPAAEGNLPGNLITIDGSHFLILPTQEMLNLPDQTYQNKLVIRGATETHAGMYICLAANTMGYNFRYAYLKVVPGSVNSSGSTLSPRTVLLPRSHNQDSESPISWPVMIAVPAGIGLLVVLLVACICQKNKKWRLQGSAGKNATQRTARMSAFSCSETKSSTRSTPVPQEYDQGVPDEQWNREQQLTINSEFPNAGRNSTNYYVYNHRVPPTVGTPLLTVEEPDGSESKSLVTDDDTYCNVPVAPPSSEVTSPCPTEKIPGVHPPPPSQKSASSLSSYHHMRAPYLHHYHYMHPPGNSRRHHSHHNHHSRRAHHH